VARDEGDEMSTVGGKTAIITGGGGGIGRGVALQFGKAGGNVVIAEADSESGRRVSAELDAMAIPVLSLHCDISSEGDVKALMEASAERFGHIDILVNIAHWSAPKAQPQDVCTDDWLRVNAVGPTGTFLCCREVFPYMRAVGKGKIINFGSEMSENVPSNRAAYSAAKGAIRSLTKVLARAWGQYNINVNTVWPSAVTPLWERWEADYPEEAKRIVEEEMALKRKGDPELDVGRVVLFLASDDADWITGQTVVANGGRTMW
jgi:NAD(P)-dependent dehydrogenase (short-subunit alcohol dehydrogenase family)